MEKPESGCPLAYEWSNCPNSRVEREQPVVAVVERRQVRPSVAEHARPQEPVHEVVAGRHVLDRHAVGLDHRDPVVEREPALQDHPVAVQTPDREERRRHDHRLLVDAGRDHDDAARLGRVHRGLDRRLVLRHTDLGAGERGRGLATRSDVRRGPRDRRVADQHQAGHPGTGRTVDRAEVGVGALGRERLVEHLAGREIRRGERAVVGRDVVRAAALVGPLDRPAHRDPDDPRGEDVVEHLDLAIRPPWTRPARARPGGRARAGTRAG